MIDDRGAMRLKLALRHGFLRAFYRPSQRNTALGSKTNESYVLGSKTNESYVLGRAFWHSYRHVSSQPALSLDSTSTNSLKISS